jgi:hypothetical protein
MSQLVTFTVLNLISTKFFRNHWLTPSLRPIQRAANFGDLNFSDLWMNNRRAQEGKKVMDKSEFLCDLAEE